VTSAQNGSRHIIEWAGISQPKDRCYINKGSTTCFRMGESVLPKRGAGCRILPGSKKKFEDSDCGEQTCEATHELNRPTG